MNNNYINITYIYIFPLESNYVILLIVAPGNACDVHPLFPSTYFGIDAEIIVALFHKVLPITYFQFQKVLKSLIKSIGKDPDEYSSHSFRRGGTSWELAVQLNFVLQIVLFLTMIC
jgi:hypothetical protein